MQKSKVLYLLALLICINARVIKRQNRIRQRPVSAPACNCPAIRETACSCKTLEPTYGGVGTCNCQSIYLDELGNYGCGCKYVESYGVLNPELSNYARVPAVKLPQVIASYDSGALPAINLPGLYDLVIDLPSCQCQAMPPYAVDFPSCQCQAMPPYVIDIPSYPFQAGSYQIVDSPCSCRTLQAPFEVPSPILKVPYAEPYYIQANCQPSCGCPLPRECGCQNLNMPCRDSGIKVSYGLPSGCQNPINCGCQNPITCGCQSLINCGCQNSITCGCQSPINGGCQNVVQYGPQLPALEAPCACQICQLAPVDLPVYGYGCQSLPPPVIGCEGKYLRQVTLQPPFL